MPEHTTEIKKGASSCANMKLGAPANILSAINLSTFIINRKPYVLQNFHEINLSEV